MQDVAIITRTKDRPILLRRALESVAYQTYKNYQWVIVNDGGNRKPVDDIVQMAKQREIPVMVIHNEKSLGMEAASNKGIHATQSKYIVVHDDDDSWDKNFLMETTNFLEQEENQCYKGVVTQSYRIDEKIVNDNEYKIIRKYPFNKDMSCISLAEMAKNNIYPPISFLYKREVYEKVGDYNEALPVLGDWEFNLRFLLCADIGVIKQPLANYHHRLTTNSVIYGNSIIQGIDKHQKYDNLIRNNLLRADIENNKLGLGYLVNSQKLNRNLYSKSVLSNINRVIKNQGIQGLLAKLRKNR